MRRKCILAGHGVWIWALLFAGIIFAQEMVGPRTGDSVEYAFVYPASESEQQYRLVESMADLVESQTNFYDFENGRVVVHTLVQLLCTVRWPVVFALLDAIMFLALVILLARFVEMRRTHGGIFLTAAAAYIYIAPCSTDVAFQVNYLWVAVLVTGFLYIFWHPGKRRRWVPLQVLLAFAAGQSNEAFTFGLALALMVWFSRHISRATVAQWAMTIAFMVGFLFNVLAPANQLRIADFTPAPPLHRILDITLNNWLLAVLLVLLWIRKKQGCRVGNYLRQHTFSIMAYLTQGLVLLIIGAVYLYATMGMRLLLVIWLLQVLKDVRMRGWPAVVFGCMVIFYGVYRVYSESVLKQKYDYIYRAYMQAGDGRVALPSQLLGWDYRWTVAHSRPYTMVRRGRHRESPPIRVLAEGLENIPEHLDTNMIIKADDTTWLTVRSKRRPRNFYVVKRLNFGNRPVVSIRKMNFDPARRLDYWSEADAWVAGVYHNRFPFLFSAEVVDTLEGK